MGAGVKIHPELTQYLLNQSDEEPDNLPLLQHLLRRLFEQWEEDGRQGAITAAMAKKVGSLTEALDKDAEAVYKGLPPGEQPGAQMLFRRITESRRAEREDGDRPVRLPQTVASLAKLAHIDESDLREVVRPFEHRGLLVMRKSDQGDRVDIPHESLCLKWQTLRNWILLEAEDAKRLRFLAEAVEKRNDLTGVTLAEAQDWLDAGKLTGDWCLRYLSDKQRLELVRWVKESQRKAEEERDRARRRQAEKGQIANVEELLEASPSARELHSIWESRRPASTDGGRTISDRTYVPWLEDASVARRFTSQALRREEYLLVVEASREILRIWSKVNENDQTELVYVRMDLAEALSRLGFMTEAQDELEKCLTSDFTPVLSKGLQTDILLKLGRIMRDEWHYATARAAQVQTAQDVLTVSERVLQLDSTRLEGLILKAATSRLLSTLLSSTLGGELFAQSAETARLVLARTKALIDENGPRVITTWAEATAHAVLGQIDEAARGYERLQHMAGVETAYLAQTRFEARFVAETLGQPRNCFDKAFPALKLVVFAGHLPDHQDRTGRRARFLPESLPGTKKKEIRAIIERLGTHIVGLASASAGADLLFVEAMQDLNHTVHLVLPWSRDEFLRNGVLPYEPKTGPAVWAPLFDQALARSTTIHEIGQIYEPGDDAGWQYLLEVTVGIALQTARALRLDIQPLALWDGLPSLTAGGTGSFYSLWNEFDKTPIVVRPPAIEEQGPAISVIPTRRSERPFLRQEVKSVLFADIVGYSRLTPKVMPAFIGTFLERLGRLTAISNHRPFNVNT